MIPVGQLASRILHYGKGGLLFMLTAHFDESETQGADPHHFMISGYVSDENGWRQFERRWQHALVCDGFQKHGIHWTDFVTGHDDFAAIGGPENEKRRIRLQKKYLSIIKKSPIQGIYSDFNMADFERAIPTIRKIRQSKPYRLAYYHAFESVIGRLCALLKQHDLLGDDEKIAFIFDQNKQTENKAKEIFDHIRRNRAIWFWKHLGTIAFSDYADHPGLQASDALANELQRQFVGDNDRWQLVKLLEGDQVADFPFTREMFDEFAKTLEREIAAFLAQKADGEGD